MLRTNEQRTMWFDSIRFDSHALNICCACVSFSNRQSATFTHYLQQRIEPQYLQSKRCVRLCCAVLYLTMAAKESLSWYFSSRRCEIARRLIRSEHNSIAIRRKKLIRSASSAEWFRCISFKSFKKFFEIMCNLLSNCLGMSFVSSKEDRSAVVIVITYKSINTIARLHIQNTFVEQAVKIDFVERGVNDINFTYHCSVLSLPCASSCLCRPHTTTGGSCCTNASHV